MRFGLAEKLELLQTMQYMEIGGGAGYTVGLRTLWILQYMLPDKGGNDGNLYSCRRLGVSVENRKGNRFWENE